MKFRTILGFAAAMLLSWPAVVAAEDVQKDPHLAAALDLLDATNAKANMAAVIDTLTPLIIGQVRQQYPDAKDSVMQDFESALRDEFTGSIGEMMTLTAKVYSEHFSDAELHGLAAFYRTGIGKKCIAELPGIAKESEPLGAAWGEQLGVRAMQRALDRLKREGLTL